jgi:hypothetical protein
MGVEVPDKGSPVSPIKPFGDIAQGLARNPLGIIALFIVLVYAIAALVASASAMTADDRRPLIWFLVAFPPVVLAAFYRLVTGHHTKLYAPADYADKDGFFRALSPEEQRRRLDDEARPLEDGARSTGEPGKPLGEPATLEPSGQLSPGTPKAPPAVNGTDRGRVVGDAITRGARIDFREVYTLAESLALRDLETELKQPIKRHVAVGGYPVDGVYFDGTTPVVIEVKLLTPKNWKNSVRDALARLGELRQSISVPARFVFIGVGVELHDERRAEIEREMSKLARTAGLSVDVRVPDLESLREKYGVARAAGLTAG